MSVESMTEKKLLRLRESSASPEAHKILAPILTKLLAYRSPKAVRPQAQISHSREVFSGCPERRPVAGPAGDIRRGG